MKNLLFSECGGYHLSDNGGLFSIDVCRDTENEPFFTVTLHGQFVIETMAPLAKLLDRLPYLPRTLRYARSLLAALREANEAYEAMRIEQSGPPN